ncbi:PfkB family carbohydrate kinase [Clostridium oceanicum]|uniref:PfkB family carbohydrate kinase n=1 Tax=Clostridium oceanicum TaxID=1543 RepID=A0ABN1JEU9_9CLOT
MTGREKEILDLIEKNPLMSQKEIANILGITRSSVAVHITNLLKKGKILGKGYIVSKGDDYVSIIGGANMDLQGFPEKQLILKDSNPGKTKVSLGGVGRNIGENLTKLNVSTKLISAVGDDMYGKKILDEARFIGLDMEHSLIIKEEATSTYLSVLNEDGDMEIAISDMEILNKMSIDFMKGKKSLIEGSNICILDTNISKEIIEYVVTNFKDTKFFLDTVSTTKSKKVKDIIGKFHTIKPNKIEAEILSGIKINTKEDLEKVALFFLKKGVKRVFITLGSEGVYYNDGKNKGKINSPKIKPVNTTGAGDAFVAALTYSYINNFNIEYTVKFSIAASILAMSHENTINPNFCAQNINNKMKELELC